ncbi:Uncharacterized conserved protein YfdQ, DUF2303 family [Actinacidiphila rubida]|uniref:Uncharacterized conserved protein YfdQ, DUF2303 family n=1 Tax=Actinacidiphila rubida TaxID=310780 RepID=A0A1H8SWR1_9ACTN|nr:DUF2303 family protein [Actinacidiphila rubida]SEO83067.1 Uncharacterized conserved protein YfdQ, DUF2303 family [Actinacidiphila rubida]
MPSYDTNLRAATAGDGTQAVIDTAIRSAAPAELTPGKVYVVQTPNGAQQFDLTGDQYKALPSRKTGTTTVRDAKSFLALWGKHSDAASEIYSDADRLAITAVLNASASDTADWGDHRIRLELRETEAWKAWASNDGKLMGQEDFAEFIEDHLPEILKPAAADMLEIAQSIQGTVKAEFASGTRLSTGQRQLAYTETVTAKAGQKGTLTIPETFTVGLLPFEGLTGGYSIDARLRYRIDGPGLKLAYKLDRPADARAKAFADVIGQVAADIDHPILNGTPTGAR